MKPELTCKIGSNCERKIIGAKFIFPTNAFGLSHNKTFGRTAKAAAQFGVRYTRKVNHHVQEEANNFRNRIEQRLQIHV